MSITFTNKFLTELKNPNRVRNIFIEIDLTVSITHRWGLHKLLPDVRPVMKSINSFQNKLSVKQNLSTKGNLSFSIASNPYMDNIIQTYRLKNLRIRKYEGFIADGWVLGDYNKTFEGIISDWSKSEDVYSFSARDIRERAQKVAPTAKADKTQYLDLSDMNPIDMMTNFINVQAGIASGDYDGAKFISERDTWYNNWKYHRVVTKSKNIDKYLEELQVETSSYIYHDGDKISFKSFAPLAPGTTVRELSDDYNLLSASVNNESGYSDHFFNRVEVYFDYDESGGDKKEDNYESVIVKENTTSQTDWDEVKTKIIKSKFIRSYKFDQPVDVTGCIIYMASKDNGAGAGTLAFTYSTQSFTWTANGDSAGTVKKITKSGIYQIKSANDEKYIRIIIDITALPGSNKSDSITLTALNGSIYANTIASRLVNRFSSPVATVKGSIDFKDMNNSGSLYAPTDLFRLTTDKVTVFGQGNFNQELCMMLSVRPDEKEQKINFEAIQAKLNTRAGFIAPSGQPNYDTASEAQREYAHIGRTSDNKVYDGSDYVDGFYVI